MSIIAFALAAALQTAPAETAESRIDAVLDQLNVASSKADLDTYIGLFTPDARFVGTDRTERWTLDELKAYAAPGFTRGQGWSYVPSERVVTVADIDCRCVAWFDEQLTNASYGAARGSGVMRLVDGDWKIAQYVLSFPVPNEVADQVVDVIKASQLEADHVETPEASPAP